jgi:hypothetical protein
MKTLTRTHIVALFMLGACGATVDGEEHGSDPSAHVIETGKPDKGSGGSAGAAPDARPAPSGTGGAVVQVDGGSATGGAGGQAVQPDGGAATDTSKADASATDTSKPDATTAPRNYPACPPDAFSNDAICAGPGSTEYKVNALRKDGYRCITVRWKNLPPSLRVSCLLPSIGNVDTSSFLVVDSCSECH